VSDVKVTLEITQRKNSNGCCSVSARLKGSFGDELKDFEDYAAACGHPIELTSTNDYIDYSDSPSREAMEAVLDGYGNEDDLAE
jgi:hypothetical protein